MSSKSANSGNSGHKPGAFDFDSMPSPEVAGSEFPHFGNLAPAAEAKLRELGWKPRDVRAIVDSTAIRLMYQAARLGLIELSKPQLDALKEERMYWETMQEIEERKKNAEREKGVDVVSILEAFKSSGLNVGVTPTSERKFGRPPGSKNRKVDDEPT